MSDTAWFAVVTPFSYGMPIFDPIACTTMCVVMVVVMIKSLGMFLALGEICDRPLDKEDLTRGLRVDGLGTLIADVLNAFSSSSFFAECSALFGVTGVRSRWVCAAGGVILIAAWPDPETGRDRRIGPLFVLGGAGLVMFGMVTATGIGICRREPSKKNRTTC